MTARDGAKKILLVHEAKLFLRMEQTALQRRGYQIYVASTGFRALETAREKTPELIIFDSALSDMDGSEICRRVRATPATRHTSLLVVLREGTDDEIERFMRAGVNDWIRKPINRIELTERVARLLAIPARRFLRTLVRLEVEVEAPGSRRRMFGTTLNLSTGGMLLETPEPLKEGSRVDVVFFLPGSEEPVTVSGDVVRAAGELPQERRGYGLRFVSPPAALRRRIAAFIEEIEPPVS